MFYQREMGRIPKNFNLDGFDITNQSAVMVTAAQWLPPPAFFGGADTRLHVHGPDVHVTNVVPHGPEGGPGGVEFMLHVDSAEPINVAVTITVFEPFEDHLLV